MIIKVNEILSEMSTMPSLFLLRLILILLVIASLHSRKPSLLFSECQVVLLTRNSLNISSALLIFLPYQLLCRQESKFFQRHFNFYFVNLMKSIMTLLFTSPTQNHVYNVTGRSYSPYSPKPTPAFDEIL